MRAPEPASLELRLQARPESTSLLRERVRLWLDEIGATSDEIFAVSLAMTEAFGNAVEHPREPSAALIEVTGAVLGETIRVTVRDYGSWRYERRREEGGYGFRLMQDLMDGVEVDSWAGGTAVTMQRQLGALSAPAHLGGPMKSPGVAARAPTA